MKVIWVRKYYCIRSAEGKKPKRLNSSALCNLGPELKAAPKTTRDPVLLGSLNQTTNQRKKLDDVTLSSVYYRYLMLYVCESNLPKKQ